MIVTRKALSRRTVLRGAGAVLALPLLDSMVPAFGEARALAAATPRRLGAIYVPNGIWMARWTPAVTGTAYELPSTLKPLSAHRAQTSVFTGLSTAGLPKNSGVHASASTKFLTSANPRNTQGSAVEAGISMDQLAAREFGQATQLASLELGLESAEAGTCDIGFSCAYTNTVAWRGAKTPLPMENNPRAVFGRLFGATGSTSQAARLERIQNERSILDSVTEKIGRLSRTLGPSDRTKLAEYTDAISDVERRIQRAEEQSARELPTLVQPAGIPSTFEEHAKLMFDLQVLAYQADLTRVVTFMIGREFSGRAYPEVGAPDAHHPTSHHENDPVKLERLSRINTFHVSLFAYFVDRLGATQEGDGTLLDHVMLLYGSGMSDGNAHSHSNLPIVVVGGGTGQLPVARHLQYPDETPLANLHVALLDKLGVRTDVFGNSTGSLAGV
ncbi:MAG: DUF1552 domain-containing protein [Vicinamibacterales bacterium]